MSFSRSPFSDAMAQLEALNRSSRDRQDRNLARLSSLVDRLDVSDSSTSTLPTEPSSDSMMRSPERETRPERRSTDDGPDVLLPRRTTHGGDYGASIRERVIASYGIDRR